MPSLQRTNSLRKIALNSAAILPPLIVAFYWPLIVVTQFSSKLAELYYAFVFAFSYYFVGEPIKRVKKELFADLDKIASSSDGLKLLEVGPGQFVNLVKAMSATQLLLSRNWIELRLLPGKYAFDNRRAQSVSRASYPRFEVEAQANSF